MYIGIEVSRSVRGASRVRIHRNITVAGVTRSACTMGKRTNAVHSVNRKARVREQVTNHLGLGTFQSLITARK